MSEKPNEPQSEAGSNGTSSESELTLKQQLFVRYFTDPEGPAFGNATRATELAGYKGEPGSNQLAVQGHSNLKNPKIQRTVGEILDTAGCTVECGAKRLKEGMDAEQSRPFLDKNGELTHSKPVPDFRERRQATELVLRLRGFLGPQRELAQANFASERREQAIRVPESPRMALLVEEVRQFSVPDRCALRKITQQILAIARLTRNKLEVERFGKPLREIEQELDAEAIKCTVARFREETNKRKQRTGPDSQKET